MFTKQVSVFVANEKGRLAAVTQVLAEQQVNIRALALADLADVGVLRLIVNDRARCVAGLRAVGLTVQETDVIAVEIEDRPGGLHRIVGLCGQHGLNIEYMYAFFEKSAGKAIVVLKFDEADRALVVLRAHGIPIVPEDQMQNL